MATKTILAQNSHKTTICVRVTQTPTLLQFHVYLSQLPAVVSWLPPNGGNTMSHLPPNGGKTGSQLPQIDSKTASQLLPNDCKTGSQLPPNDSKTGSQLLLLDSKTGVSAYLSCGPPAHLKTGHFSIPVVPAAAPTANSSTLPVKFLNFLPVLMSKTLKMTVALSLGLLGS